ncbi:unnamed protein product [Schistocephalus solidus]|uniref:Uncharacterized protein n=1 Tax=Schistocephalus solidus TaxID=70667 RepID=A0A183T0J9_SCHSO|nr:unnamed protein product [Schistocephalus solidus]
MCLHFTKRLFYGDVATGARRQAGQKRRYKDTLKKFLKQLQINPVTWKNLARMAWKRSVKTDAAIYEANRIAADMAKSVACKSQAPPDQHRQCRCPANVPTLPTHIPRANRPGRKSSNSMQQQSLNLNYCHTCLRPLDDNRPNQLHRCPAAHDYRHHPPSSTPCADHDDESHLNHSCHLSSHLRIPATCYLQHPAIPSISDGTRH